MREASYLTLFYTANLAGQLDLLPALYTLICQVKESLDGPTLLVDMGGSCASGVWECAATANRAALYVFDAMGYDLACLSEVDCAPMDAVAVAKLAGGVQMKLCGPVGYDGLRQTVSLQVGGWHIGWSAPGAGSASDTALPERGIIVRPVAAGEPARLEPESRTLWLAAPSGGILGIVDITWSEGALSATWRTMPIPKDVHPDATIAAAVDFVREEARLYDQVRQRSVEDHCWHVTHKGGAHETG